MMLSTLRRCLPSLSQLFWRHCHRFMHQYISKVIPNPVELTLKVNNDNSTLCQHDTQTHFFKYYSSPGLRSLHLIILRALSLSLNIYTVLACQHCSKVRKSYFHTQDNLHCGLLKYQMPSLTLLIHNGTE